MDIVDRAGLMARAMPWALPGLGIALVLAVLVSGPVSRWLRCGRATAIVTVFFWLAVVAVVDTPSVAPGGGRRFCSLRVSGLVSWHQLVSLGDRGLNVVLLVPVGLAVAWLGRRGALIDLGVGLVLPVVVEAIQFAAGGWLGRSCQLTDVADGYTGLLAGAVAGLLVVASGRGWRAVAARRAARPAGR